MVITRAGNTVKAYVNGALAASSPSFPSDPLPIYSNGLMVGCTKADAGQWTRWYGYNGLIADVRIYNKALTEAEVKNLTTALAPKRQMLEGRVSK